MGGIQLVLGSGLEAGDDVLVGDGVVQRDEDSRERDRLLQPLGRLDSLPRLQIGVQQRRAIRLVLLPREGVEVDERMRDAGVRPVGRR